MIRVLALITYIIFFIACGSETGADQKGAKLANGSELEKKAPDLKKEKKNLMETDRLFSKASEDKGFGEAFSLFAAEEARVFQNKLMPILGKDAIVKFMTEKVKGTITWEPYFVEMAESAELGYTLGKSQSTVQSDSGKRTVSYGHYVTIWKKQSDGSWKLVFDSGIETPE